MAHQDLVHLISIHQSLPRRFETNSEILEYVQKQKRNGLAANIANT